MSSLPTKKKTLSPFFHIVSFTSIYIYIYKSTHSIVEYRSLDLVEQLISLDAILCCPPIQAWILGGFQLPSSKSQTKTLLQYVKKALKMVAVFIMTCFRRTRQCHMYSIYSPHVVLLRYFNVKKNCPTSSQSK